MQQWRKVVQQIWYANFLICYMKQMLNSSYVFDDFQALKEKQLRFYFLMQNTYNIKLMNF